MKNKKLWIIIILVVALLGAGIIFRADLMEMVGLGASSGQQASAQTPQGGNFDPANITTTTIRPADDAALVSAAGNIELAEERPVVLQVGGLVTEVHVDAGDAVLQGDTLVALDTTALERAVEQAKLSVASSQIQFDNLLEPADDTDIASAEASLASAKENLAEVKAGPSNAELAAARANLAAAQAKYNDLLAGPSEDELTQLSANLEKAYIDLQQAQANYNQIAYSDSVGASPQAAALQQATIDYQSTLAAYNIATEAASEADLQSALNTLNNAREQLDTLLNQPTAADIASAEAQVASAQATLDNLTGPADESDLEAARISLEKAQLDLAAAEENLQYARLLAPMDGTVLDVNVSVGQNAASGLQAVTLADLTALELTVNVAEVDISKVSLGQTAQITIDALPDDEFTGQVVRIAPASDSSQGVVNYPVTIQLAAANLTGVRPGMTAVATILNDSVEGSWLVPTGAIRDRNGQSVVMILRDGQPTPVTVTTQGTQGDWTIVASDELQAGDEAIGTVTSFVSDSSTETGFGGPPDGGMMRLGGGGGGGGNRGGN